MKPSLWIPAVAFLATSIPTVLALQHYQLGGDYRLLIALVVGAAASGLAQARLNRQEKPE